MQTKTPPSSVVYRRSRIAAVLHAVPIARVARRLECTGLRPVQLGGFGVVNVGWFDYGQTSIGGYRELSVGILASPEQLDVMSVSNLLLGRAGPFGAYVLALPVDSEQARTGGIEQYGLPKSLVGFRFTWESRQLTAGVLEQGPVIEATLPLGLGFPAWIRELVVYSKHRDALLTTRIATSWFAQVDLIGRPQYTIRQHLHPLGALFDDLDLARAPTLAILHGRLNFAELPLPP